MLVRRAPAVRGVTLVELAVVMSIAAVAAAFAWPAYQQGRQEHLWRAAADEFLASLLHARAEAFGRGQRIAVAPADGQHWQSGWRVFVDGDLDGRPGPGDAVLVRHDALPTSISVESRQTSGGALPSIAYAPSGHSRAGRWGWAAGSVDFIWHGRARCVIVNMMGRPRLASSDDGHAGCRARG